MGKYIIEIEDVPFSKIHIDADNGAQNINLYRAKGFNALVFDEHGLDKLTPLDKALSSELGEAYQKGFEVGQHEATTLEYQQGLDDAWGIIIKIALIPYAERSEIFDGQQDILSIVQKFSPSEVVAKLKAYEEQQKADEIKVSDIITDGKINYLVTDITDKSYVALKGTDFEPSYIGKDYIKSYHNLHDSKDMQKIAEEITKTMKGEQRICSTCRYSGGSDLSKCSDCIYCSAKAYTEWEPKEGEV